MVSRLSGLRRVSGRGQYSLVKNIMSGGQNSPVNNVPSKSFVEQAKTQSFGFPEAL